LPDSLHQFAETAADEQQDAKLGEKYCLRSAGSLSLCSEGERNSAEQKNRRKQAAPRDGCSRRRRPNRCAIAARKRSFKHAWSYIAQLVVAPRLQTNAAHVPAFR